VAGCYDAIPQLQDTLGGLLPNSVFLGPSPLSDLAEQASEVAQNSLNALGSIQQVQHREWSLDVLLAGDCMLTLPWLAAQQCD